MIESGAAPRCQAWVWYSNGLISVICRHASLHGDGPANSTRSVTAKPVKVCHREARRIASPFPSSETILKAGKSWNHGAHIDHGEKGAEEDKMTAADELKWTIDRELTQRIKRLQIYTNICMGP